MRICTGKPTTIVASQKGFYPAGKRILLSHSLAGLLKQISRIFDSVSENQSILCSSFPNLLLNLLLLRFCYSSMFATADHLKFLYLCYIYLTQAFKSLMKAFTEHNKVSDLVFKPKMNFGQCNNVICNLSVWQSSIWLSSKYLVSTLCCC